MKKLSIACLLLTFYIQSNEDQPYIKGHTTFSIRSQNSHGAFKHSGTHIYERACPEILTKKRISHTGVAVAYSQSRRGENSARALFGADHFSVRGSHALNRQPNDLLADYFGLSQEYQGTIHFAPHIQTTQCALHYYTAFPQTACGLYGKIYTPFVTTRWNMHLHEEIKESGITTAYDEGYMDLVSIKPPLGSFKQALNGTTTFGQMQEPLRYGKINGPLTKSGFADIQLTLGCTPYRTWLSHVNIGLMVSIPTGTHRNAHHLFSPQIGNGHHWEIGAELAGHTTVWEKDGTQTFQLYGNVVFSHLISTKQQRSFDIHTNRNMSRYMLVKEFNADAQYTGNLSPLINHTTFNCHVRTDLQCDIVGLMSYIHTHFTCELGYNGWIKTHEHISLDCTLAEKKYGLKGIQNGGIVPLGLSNTTQSNATIYGNQFNGPTDQQAVADTFSPVFLKSSDIDISSAASPRLITHTLFAHAGYRWGTNNARIQPSVSAGAAIEFEGENRHKTVQEHHHTLTLWTVWLKAGLEF